MLFKFRIKLHIEINKLNKLLCDIIYYYVTAVFE